MTDVKIRPSLMNDGLTDVNNANGLILLAFNRNTDFTEQLLRFHFHLCLMDLRFNGIRTVLAAGVVTVDAVGAVEGSIVVVWCW